MIVGPGRKKVAEPSHSRPRVLCVVGARPNFMKIAPLMRAFSAKAPQLDVRLVHTGQHYDVAMNERFFRRLSIPCIRFVSLGSH